jgi:hypothetical protein
MPDDVPRVDELFSRAVVAQLAEQRAQRETYAELERKLGAVERLVTERLSELSKLLRGGEVQMRLDLLEEGLNERISGLEKAVQSGGSKSGLEEISGRLGRLEESARGDERNQILTTLETTLKRRLGQLEDAVRVDDTGRRLSALELAVTERLGQLEEGVNGEATGLRALELAVTQRLSQLEERVNGEATGLHLDALEESLGERFAQLEGSVRADHVGARLGDLEHSMDERLSQLEEAVRDQDLARRLDVLEQVMGERLGHLEESVRSEEIGDRLKAIELAIEERSQRPADSARTDLEERINALDQIIRERLNTMVEASGPGRLDALDQALGYRLTRLEGSLRRMEEHTTSRLEDLKEASQAAEAGILERIIAESQVVGAHFQAVRPVVEAAFEARPELQETLAEVRELMEATRPAVTRPAVEAPPGPSDGDTGPFPADALRPPSEAEQADTVFLAPEETPIPDRRFEFLPRRDKLPPGV